MKTLRSYIELCKVNIALFAACSAGTGYVLAQAHPTVTLLPLSVGVFLIACGSSALNQYQERKIDARMERTRQRPIPSGKTAPSHALCISLILVSAGCFFLGHISSSAVALGMIAIVWYNGVYTFLKKKSAFAAVPGALIGAIPPAIGWVAGGGEIADPRLTAVCALFFLWQVPHFWLLLITHGDEYERAGLPSLTRVFTKEQLPRITAVWMLSACVMSLALPLYGVMTSPTLSWALVPAALWLSGSAYRLLRAQAISATTVFRKINAYLFFIILMIFLDKIVA